MSRRGRPPYPDILTPREWEVLDLLRQGLSNPEIAERLGISRDVAKYHVSEILSKLGLSSRDEAVVWQPEAHRPWWAAAGAPFAFVWRKISASGVAAALSATLFVALLAGLAVIALLLLRGGGGEPQSVQDALRIPARPEVNALYVVNDDGSGLTLLAVQDSVFNVQWSPDGEALTYLTSEGGELRLERLDAGGGEPRVLRRVEDPTSRVAYLWAPGTERIAFLANDEGSLFDADSAEVGTFAASELIEWRPDGSELLVWRKTLDDPPRGDLIAIDAATLEERTLAQRVHQWQTLARWSPDGAWLAYLTATEGTSCDGGAPVALDVVAADGGERRSLLTPACSAPSAFAWSPDGTRVAYTVANVLPEGVSGGTYVVDVATGAVRLVEDASGPFDIDVWWLADGEHLAVRRADCVSCGTIPWWALLTVDGEQVAEWPGNRPQLATAPGSARLAVGTTEGELFVAGADGRPGARLFEAAPFQYKQLAWSPAGDRVAFVRAAGWKNTTFTADLTEGRLQQVELPENAYDVAYSPDLGRVAYILDRQLVVAPAGSPGAGEAIAGGAVGWVQWSPDGERIGFLHEEAFPEQHLAVVGANGERLRLLATMDAGTQPGRFVWTPDSDGLLFEHYAGGGRASELINIATGERTAVAAAPGAWSPDGTRIAYLEHGEIIVAGGDGSDRRSVLTLTLGFGAPAWSPDGETLVVVEAAANGKLWLVDVETGEAELVASAEPRAGRFAGENTPNLRGYGNELRPAWSPDGSQIAINFLSEGGHGIFLYDVESGELRPVTLTARSDHRHVILGWSRDGERLALESEWCLGACF